MKKSFVLYTDMWDTVDKLSDRDLGRLMKAVFHYQALGELPEKLSAPAAVVFDILRKQLDRDNEKYEQVCRRRSEAGKKGAYVSHQGKTALPDELMIHRERIRSSMGINE